MDTRIFLQKIMKDRLFPGSDRQKKDRTVSAFTEPDEEAYQKGCEALKEAGYEETGKIWLEKRIRSYGIGVFVAAIGILCIVGLLTELHMEKKTEKSTG